MLRTWRHRLAYCLRLLAWRLDPRPELQADIARLLEESKTPKRGTGLTTTGESR
jgi:hypothetical protein